MQSMLLTLGTLFLANAALSAYLVTQLPRSFWLKFVTVPVVLMIAVLFFLNLPAIEGYPHVGIPSGKFQVNYATVSTGKGGQQSIDFIATDSHGKSRYYEIPFNAGIFAAMQQAIENARNGKGVTTFTMDHKGDAPGQGNGDSYSIAQQIAPIVDVLPPKQ